MKTFKGTVLFTGKKQCRVKANSADEAKEKVQDLLDSTEYLKVYPDEMNVAKISVQELENDDSEVEYLVEVNALSQICLRSWNPCFANTKKTIKWDRARYCLSKHRLCICTADLLGRCAPKTRQGR